MTQVLLESFKLSWFYPAIYTIPVVPAVHGDWIAAAITLQLTLLIHVLSCNFMMQMSIEDAIIKENIKRRPGRNDKHGREAEDVPKAPESGKKMP